MKKETSTSQTKKVLAKIWDFQTKKEELYPEAITALFKEIKGLQNFVLEANEEYDDNNYYTQVSIEQINDIPCPYGIVGDYFAEEVDDDSRWKTFFMAAKIKVEDALKILEVIEALDSNYVQNQLCYNPVKRSDYVKKPKKSTTKV